ncbi:transmembrane protease serine 11B-like [Microcebus murinus]|uniref:transmembrane protease serine 11B-like n=1 Tax=Microcebus murinus TaxID=30608 RepID=UPI003F6D8A69
MNDLAQICSQISEMYGTSSRRQSWPLWKTVLIFLGVVAILGVTIGLLVHFLAVGRVYYYQGDFRISGVIYNESCENAASQNSTDLSKDIETKMLYTFHNSSIYKEYVNSEVIKLLPSANGSSVQLQLTFKFPPAKRDLMRTKIKAILRKMLEDNMTFWNAVPDSIKLTEISKANYEMLTNNCCGRRLANNIIAGNKIVNGQKAPEGAWPWQASLRWRGSHTCGASLIGRRWLLSAAHCFAAKNNSADWTVSFGTTLNKPYMTRKVQNIIFHENYSSPAVVNDIALVQLAEEVSFTKYVRRICLPEAQMELPENASVVVTGWGVLYMNGPHPVVLQEAFLKIIDNENCNAPHALSNLVTDEMLCAGFMSGEADACQNDSGGPLAYPDSRNIWHLVGIVSWGDGCGKKNKPGVYTRVTSYRDWITSKTGL